jgi:hypothetical protein
MSEGPDDAAEASAGTSPRPSGLEPSARSATDRADEPSARSPLRRRLFHGLWIQPCAKQYLAEGETSSHWLADRWLRPLLSSTPGRAGRSDARARIRASLTR